MNALALSGTVLVPKNRGLARQVACAIGHCADQAYAPCVVRGEDVPYLANELVRAGRSVLAFTGDDLVEEWLAGGNVFDGRLKRGRVIWYDPEAIYGAPSLCLIGKSSLDRRLMQSAKLRIAVCARYRHLAERFLTQWVGCMMGYQLILIAGAVETTLLQDIADLVIDIVVTGRTVAASGLHVHRVISTSDLAVLESVQ